jgi:DNA repair protein RecN (Recombination protein N)
VLTHLSILNLTLVDSLELEFGTGMSVITGETGAGKSIMLGALGLALGDRADSSLISPGADKAEINASFDLKDNQEALDWLEQRDLGDGEHCILRRVIGRDGRSRAFINGSTMNVGELKSLGQMLINIHSQHEHQSLLRKETHRRLLDEFGGLTEITDELGALFDTASALQQRLEQLTADAAEQTARVQLLSYQAEELTTLDLNPGETAQLEEEQKRLNSADVTRQKLSEVIELCDKENDASASSLTSRALTLLNSIEDDAISSIREMLSSALIQLDEAMSDLDDALGTFDSDPGRLHEVEDRLGSIYEIARKHKVSPDELTELTTRIQSELDDIVNADARIAELDARLAKARKHYQSLAEKLTASRNKTGELLQTEVTTQLQGLGMDGATFSVSIEPFKNASRSGMDDIELRIATIPGNAPGSLSRIASGGELSRISLAIQVITAKTSNTPTLIFDEVDVGVGGATAEVVGSLLRKLGGDAQVVCVTHLPQVAAQGHHHYVVNKSTTENSASTTVTRLTEEEKIEEIARMLGGVQKTEQSLAHAESMISGAKSA